MKKKLLTVLPILLFFLYNGWQLVFAQQRLHLDFDAGWKFSKGHAADPSKDFNYGIQTIFSKTGAAQGTAIDPSFNDSSWKSVDLPHDWAVGLPFANSPRPEQQAHGYKAIGSDFPENSIGWYRKKFTVPANDSALHYQVEFEGIFRDAECWINGFYLGNHKSGYTGVSYDLKPYLRYGKENVIVLRVDATQYEGWFYEGAGIYRHAWLNRYPSVHLAQNPVFFYSEVVQNRARLFFETTVENENYSDEALSLSVRVTSRDGELIAETSSMSFRLEAGRSTTIKQSLSLSSPRLWSLEDPYLYRIFAVLKSGGVAIDNKLIPVGIRRVEIKPNGVFLNGKHVKLKGTNNHQDHAGVGAAIPDALQYHRVFLLKQLGSNAYRASHNPPSPALLDACDSLGMLVMDENRLLNSSPQYLEDFKLLILRDRSRACVFMWSIGNEEGWVQGNATGKAIAQQLLALQKKIDPTRVSTYAADLGNVFTGINEVIPVRGFNYRQFAVEDYHREHPGQPIIGTEMGSTVTTRGVYQIKGASETVVPDQDITAPWWASTAETWWKMAADKDYWLGGFIWTGFDYRGEPTPFQWPNINSHFGIMDVCGFPKNIYYYYKSWWTDKDVLHISPHWNWPGREGEPIDVWVNSNADEVELFLNDKSFGKQQMPRNSHLQWKVPYTAGKLEAVALKKGRVLRSSVETTQKANEVVLSPYKTTLLADGKDVAIINVSVVDAQGREIPDAESRIRFHVNGDARIIGTGNGNPNSHEQDAYDDTVAYRQLFNGKCQFMVKSGNSAGLIHVTAKGAGLYEGAADIMTIQPGTAHLVTSGVQPYPVVKYTGAVSGPMLGADISFLPELEAKGMKFYDQEGKQDDAINLLRINGFNYMRLRIFNDPANDSGYSPKEGFCGLKPTLEMAKRIKAAGMNILLDFHYSDYWADPQKQFKPQSWKNKSFTELKKSVYDYTLMVMNALKDQGTLPEMVQPGNEINHGIIWPEGHINNLDSLAQLLYAGIQAVKTVSPKTVLMLHVALGGQQEESRFFFDQMTARGVPYDVIGLSYYPKWHNTLSDLEYNLEELSKRYQKDVIIVEYSAMKPEVNKLGFSVPGTRGKGTCIWEPLNTWDKIFDQNGKANYKLRAYQDYRKAYIK
jgi:beta-galactosidase